MIESGYYKSHTDNIYYVICQAILAIENNTQERYIVYKPVDQDTIFIKHINDFSGFIEIDGERLKRFKKLENYIPNWPPTILPNITYPVPYTIHNWPSQNIIK